MSTTQDKADSMQSIATLSKLVADLVSENAELPKAPTPPTPPATKTVEQLAVEGGR